MHGAGKALDITDRVQLELVIQADGAMRRVWHIYVLDEPHRQARFARGTVLALDGRALVLLRRMGECRPALELALDSLFGDERGNQLHPAQARLRIGRRAVAAVATAHLAVDGLLQRSDLRR